MLLVGLGNPGTRYERNRHNIGFFVINELYRRIGEPGWQEKFNGIWTKGQVGHNPCMLLMPQTYMNLSGRSVAKAANFFRVEPTDIIVIHDDLDLDYGVVRIKKGGGAGGHNGLSSCIADMGHSDFLRIRIGIGRPTFGDTAKFVLSDFTPDEQIDLEKIIGRACDALETVVKEGVVKAMNEFNQRGGS